MSAKICLNLIVGNEQDIIVNLLSNVYRTCDAVAVSYNGTDSTKDLIISFCEEKKIPCYLEYQIWTYEFDVSRNHALKIGREFTSKLDPKSKWYLFIIDADDVAFNVDETPLNINRRKLTAPIYRSLKYSENRSWSYFYYSLIRTDAEAEWKQPVHEYLYTNEMMDDIRDFYIISRRLGDRSKDKDKYKKDANKLIERLPTSELPSRTTYYIAQSFKDANDVENAKIWYRKRTEINDGYADELYASYIKLAEYEGEPYNAIAIEYLLKGYCVLPGRWEIPCMLVRNWNSLKMFYLSWTFGISVVKQEKVCSGFLYNNEDHQWVLVDQVAIAAYNLGKYREAIELYDGVLKDKTLANWVVEHLNKNRSFNKNCLNDISRQKITAMKNERRIKKKK